MNPNLAQGIAAERRADMRREADAYRRARDHGQIRLAQGRRRPGADKQPAVTAGGGMPADRTSACRAAEEMLVLPDGTAEKTDSAELCSASR
jgi:hypothetical protein